MGADYKKRAYAVYAGSTNGTIPANSEQVFAVNGGDAAGVANATFRDVPICHAGVLQHLYQHCRAVPGVGETYTCEVFLNGNLTALVSTITGAVLLDGNNVADGVAVIPGDLIRVHITTTAGAAVTYHTWSFEII